jgi:hypothetical protein
MIVETILETCRNIKCYRDMQSVFKHLESEVAELNAEIDKEYYGIKAGEDGILGESVDIILCAADMIYQSNPNITAEEILAKVRQKLEKWERLYGNK